MITAVIAAPSPIGKNVESFVNSKPVTMLIYDTGINGFSGEDKLRIFLGVDESKTAEYTFGSTDKYTVQSWYTNCGAGRLEHHDKYGRFRKWFIDIGISGFNEDYKRMVGAVERISAEIMLKIEKSARERFIKRFKDREHRSCFNSN